MAILDAAADELQALHYGTAQNQITTKSLESFKEHSDFEEIVNKIDAHLSAIRNMVATQKQNAQKSSERDQKMRQKMSKMHKINKDLATKANRRMRIIEMQKAQIERMAAIKKPLHGN